MFWAFDFEYNLNSGFARMQFDAFADMLYLNHICFLCNANINEPG